jgi:hypothetical protein
VLLTVETRDTAHHDAIVDQLQHEGFNVVPRP